MARFRSANHARLCKREIKNQINEILDFDLQDVEKTQRTLSLWFATVGQNLKHSQRKKELQTLEKDLMDAEAFLLFAKTSCISKEMFSETKS